MSQTASQATSLEARNKQLAQTFFDTLSRGDVPAMLAMYTDDACCITMGRTLISGRFSREHVAAAANQIFEAFPQGIRFEILAMTAEGDRVAIEARSEGQHISGKRYANEYHFLMRLRDGKVCELKEYMDTEHVTDVLCGGQRPAATA